MRWPLPLFCIDLPRLSQLIWSVASTGAKSAWICLFSGAFCSFQVSLKNILIIQCQNLCLNAWWCFLPPSSDQQLSPCAFSFLKKLSSDPFLIIFWSWSSCLAHLALFSWQTFFPWCRLSRFASPTAPQFMRVRQSGQIVYPSASRMPSCVVCWTIHQCHEWNGAQVRTYLLSRCHDFHFVKDSIYIYSLIYILLII
jgi:hypothetical protein